MSASGAGPPGVRLVQYVVVRSDLTQKLSWPLGAVIAQACHAATAAIHVHYDDPDTRGYLADLDSMHKVVLAVRDSRFRSVPVGPNPTGLTAVSARRLRTRPRSAGSRTPSRAQVWGTSCGWSSPRTFPRAWP